MGKLRYYYGCMGSSKSATLVMKAHQFEQNGCNVITLKSSFDDRDVGIIKPRPMEGRECILFNKEDNLFNLIKNHIIDTERNVVFVDEIQFAASQHILQLWEVAKDLNVDVYCYGLRIDYLNNLFESIKTLEVVSDTQEELKSMCRHCSNKATTHIRYINNIPQSKGESNIVGDLDGEERYESVCQVCRRKIFNEYKNKKIKYLMKK